jgi:hypothetical protein
MEMPKSCKECPMTYKDEVDYRICTIIGKNVDYGRANEIHSDCPLVEIITCKDCKHCKKDTSEGEKLLWCKRDSCAVSEDYYCGGGRRE